MYVLFVSEPYIERSLLDYFNQVTVHKFILLKANHPEIQNCIMNNIHFMHLHEALELYDYIYIFGSEKISNSIITRCSIMAKQREIPLFCTIKHQNDKEMKDYFDDIIASTPANLPTVLILQAGMNAQIEKTELNLYNSLRNNNIKYLLHTNTLFSQINTMADLLNINVIYKKNNDDAQISVISINENVLDLISNDIENIFFDKFLRTVKPDYIIMCCENDYIFQDKLNDIFKIKYSLPIDVFVRSEYVSLKSNNELEFPLFIESVMNINLFNDIRAKLTFPLGVKEIHFNH